MILRRKKMKKVHVTMLILLAFCTSAGAATLFVDDSATGANNGTSWANAYTSLQTALGAANTSDTLLVAAGVYKPDTTGDRTVAFNITDSGLTIQGGYEPLMMAGQTPPVAPPRDPDLYRTILSGDLSGDDSALPPLGGPEAAMRYFLLAEECWPGQHLPGNSPAHPAGTDTRDDNSQHVVTVNVANVTLDGVTIKGGNCYAAANNNGADIFVTATGFALKNCVVTEGFAHQGGGMYTTIGTDGTVTLDNCSFTQNTAWWEGGAIFCESGVTLVADGCVWSNNTIESCDGNEAAAIKINAPTGVWTTATFTDCLFEQNCASECLMGGSLELRGDMHGSLYLYNCLFRENWSTYGPSGLYVDGPSDLADQMWARAYNTLFVQNGSGNAWGGAVGVALWGGRFDGTNCTVAYNNHPGENAGGLGIAKARAGVINLKNSIVWGNSGCELRVWPGNNTGTITVSYSDIEADPNNAFVNGGGNIATNPLFVVADPMYNLQAGSPCIDAGDPASDWSKEPKCNGERANIGAAGGTANANPTVAAPANDPAADTNCDGNVDLADFSKLAGEWLQ
jgi:predicted outer membrane repeat protein